MPDDISQGDKLIKEVDEISRALIAKRQEMALLLARAADLEADARATRASHWAIKKECESLEFTLRHHQVQINVESAKAGAEKARREAEKVQKETEEAKVKSQAESEATMASLKAKESELDALLAKARADANLPPPA